MTGFELRTSGVGSNRDTNFAKTTAQGKITFDRQNRLLASVVVWKVIQLALQQLLRYLCRYDDGMPNNNNDNNNNNDDDDERQSGGSVLKTEKFVFYEKQKM